MGVVFVMSRKIGRFLALSSRYIMTKTPYLAIFVAKSMLLTYINRTPGS